MAVAEATSTVVVGATMVGAVIMRVAVATTKVAGETTEATAGAESAE